MQRSYRRTACDADAGSRSSRGGRICAGLTRGQDAEFVSFRIGHHNPGCAALTDVEAAGPKADESLDLRLLIVGHPFEVEPVLMLLVLGNLDEHQAGRLTRSRSQLYCVAVLVNDLPPRGRLPPSRERRKITAVDNNFLETKSHASRLGKGCHKDKEVGVPLRVPRLILR